MAEKNVVKGPREIPVLLILLSLSLFCFQYVTLEKLAIFSPGMTFLSVIRFWEIAGREVGFDFIDGLLVFAVLALAIALLLLEFGRGRLSVFLGRVFSSEKQTLLLLAACSLVLVRFYFARGMAWAGDAPQHISYAEITAQALKRGEIPTWTNYLGSGSPYLQFYGFLFFYLVAAVDLLFRDLFLSLKLVLAGTHIASGLGAYMLVRRIFRSRPAGFMAGLAYVLCFWHTQQVLIMGRLPLSLFYALLPWAFFFFEGLRYRRYRGSSVCAGAIVLGSLAFTHPGYGFGGVVLLGVYIAIRLFNFRSRRDFPTILGCALTLLGVGLAFGAFLTLPFWLERGSTGLQDHIGFTAGSDVPRPTWRHVLVWSNFRFWLLPFAEEDFHWYGGYLGLSLIALTLVGVAKGTWRKAGWKTGPVRAIGAGLALSLLLVFAHHLPPLQHLQMVQAMPAARYLLFAAFFLALGVGAGTRVLLDGSRGNKRLCTSLVIVLLADLGPTTFQQPYVAEGLSRIISYDRFREWTRPYEERGELPNYRLFWARGDMHYYLAYGQLQVEARTPLPHGYHPGELLSVSVFVNPLERFLSETLGMMPDADEPTLMRLNKTFTDAMGMLNDRGFLLTSRDHALKVLDWNGVNSPILVSSRIVEFPTDSMAILASEGEVADFLDRVLPGQSEPEPGLFPVVWLVQRSGVDLASKTCQRIFLLDYRGEQDLGTDPAVEVREHRVWNAKVELRVHVSAACFARLAYSYFPYLRVTVDGEEVTPMQTAGHFMAIPLAAGEHRIVITPYLSPLRRGLLALDMLVLCGAIWIWAKERRSIRE